MGLEDKAVDPNAATVAVPAQRQLAPPRGPRVILTVGDVVEEGILSSAADGEITVTTDRGFPLDSDVKIRSKAGDPEPTRGEGTVIWTRSEGPRTALGVRLSDGTHAAWEALLA